MPGGRRNDYVAPKPAADASVRLAEALLQSEMVKSPSSLLIRFDRAADSNAAFDVLRAMRDGYRPRRE
jgi:hypothetical protein